MLSSSSNQLKARIIFILITLLLCLIVRPLPAPAESEVHINILKTPGQKLKIALPPFFSDKSIWQTANELRGVLGNDLTLSGFFQLVTEFPEGTQLNGMEAIGRPEIFSPLLDLALQLLVNIHLQEEGDNLNLEALVFDPASGRQVFGKRYRSRKEHKIKMTHIMAGDIIKDLTGVEPMTSSRLAFLWNISGTKRVYVSDYDGQNLITISPEGELCLFPEWSPDAKSLVYTSFESSLPELIYHEVDERSRWTLASYPGMNASASFSPDGQEVLATLSKPGNPEIYKLDRKGQIIKRMTYDRGVDTSPSFSPDGKRFVFVSDRSGRPHIYIMSSQGGKPTRLSFRGHYNVSPDWSPTGKHIAYSSIVDGRLQIMIIDLSSGDVIQLTKGPGSKEDPSWGPDGRHLVFTLTKGYKSDLFILDIFTRESVLITKGKGSFTSPSWSGNIY